jgi:hypothetical protein
MRRKPDLKITQIFPRCLPGIDGDKVTSRLKWRAGMRPHELIVELLEERPVGSRPGLFFTVVI